MNFYFPQRSDVNAWKPSANETPTRSPRDYVAASIASVATTGSDENALRTLEGYVLETLRKPFFFLHQSSIFISLSCCLRYLKSFRTHLGLDPVTPGVVRIATVDRPSPPPFGTKGDRFYFDFTKAAVNPKTFDDPNEINPQRDPASYVFYQGDGVFKTLGPKFVVRVTAEVLRAVFVLKNVQRVPGKAGILRRSVSPRFMD